MYNNINLFYYHVTYMNYVYELTSSTFTVFYTKE